MPRILSLQERAALRDQILKERMETLLPTLMRENGIDLWLLIAEEYNEDPVMRTMLPATWLSARRKTILFIYDRGTTQGLELLAVARYNVGELFKAAWTPEQEPDQWKRLIQLIQERNPQRIGLNYSETFAHADGISHTEYENFMSRLPEPFKNRVVSAERLAVNWLETRTPTELMVFEQANRIAHTIIAEGLSESVIQPGVTTTNEVVWWYRERMAALTLQAWFHPTVDVQRPDQPLYAFSARPDGQTVIMPGDVLHIDLGFEYVGMHTDTQQMAYVLRPGETDMPDYLKKTLSVGNRAQDILTSHFKTGRTGNEILKLALEQAKKEGIQAQIYSHALGLHGHAAGPAIGMWDNQVHVPGTGEYPIRPNTAYAIELNVRVPIAEWQNKELRIMLEQPAVFRQDGKVQYLDGRQKEWILIPRKVQHVQP
ncbi:MAG: M24 family metallopeptidase [Cytophagales bacterium]|nr:aminopeptidase P family protein [Bernardetiaceae bacterium]MDW8204710.1 M24 family metallopeptidase [Cytophagales bacterium]